MHSWRYIEYADVGLWNRIQQCKSSRRCGARSFGRTLVSPLPLAKPKPLPSASACAWILGKPAGDCRAGSDGWWSGRATYLVESGFGCPEWLGSLSILGSEVYFKRSSLGTSLPTPGALSAWPTIPAVALSQAFRTLPPLGGILWSHQSWAACIARCYLGEGWWTSCTWWWFNLCWRVAWGCSVGRLRGMLCQPAAMSCDE